MKKRQQGILFFVFGAPILTLNEEGGQFDAAAVPELLQVPQDVGAPRALHPVHGLGKVEGALLQTRKK